MRTPTTLHDGEIIQFQFATRLGTQDTNKKASVLWTSTSCLSGVATLVLLILGAIFISVPGGMGLIGFILGIAGFLCLLLTIIAFFISVFAFQEKLTFSFCDQRLIIESNQRTTPVRSIEYDHITRMVVHVFLDKLVVDDRPKAIRFQEYAEQFNASPHVIDEITRRLKHPVIPPPKSGMIYLYQTNGAKIAIRCIQTLPVRVEKIRLILAKTVEIE